MVNSGYKNGLDSNFSQTVRKAIIPHPEKVPAKLKVSFFLFFSGDYFVLELDKDYQWTLIGSSYDKYLWILRRNPLMKNEWYTDLLNRLSKRGYDISSLIKVEQKP